MYTGKELDFIWEEAGINLHFPAATCEREIKVSVEILPNVEDNCIMPHGYRLMPMVSAVYKITASAELPAPVRVRMRHCAVIDKEEDTLVHMVAHCTSPYRFKPYLEGKFDELYGEVEITRFSVWTTLCDFFGQWLTLTLAVHVVYINDSKVHIAVTKNIPAHCKAVREEYHNIEIQQYTMVCSCITTKITFSEAEPMNLEECNIQMIPNAEINTNSIFTYQLGCIIASITLEPKWIGDRQRKEIETKIRIKGGIEEEFTLPFSFKPPMQSQEQPEQSLQQSQDQPPSKDHQLQDEPVNQDQPLQVQPTNQNQPQTNQSKQQLNRSEKPTLPLLLDFPKKSGGVIKIVKEIAKENEKH